MSKYEEPIRWINPCEREDCPQQPAWHAHDEDNPHLVDDEADTEPEDGA